MRVSEKPLTSGSSKERRTGPRGGTTTVTKSGMIRKNLWISDEENEALRRKAFEERLSETEIIRAGIRMILDLTD
ncbi:MAG: hypothetical protein AAF604_08980 [Acidobacteriota bacterium]